MENRIKEVIDSSHKTIKQISDETNINYTTLTNYYRGERSPRNKEIWEKLATYFEIDIAYLMGISENSSKDLKSKQEIGSRINLIRKQQGLSMKEFGKKLNPVAADSIVSRWERGISLPNNKRLKKIAEIGGVSTNYLIMGELQKKGETYSQILDILSDLNEYGEQEALRLLILLSKISDFTR